MIETRTLSALIGSQLRYRKRLLLWVLIGVTVVGVPVGVMAEDPAEVAKIWSLIALIAGVQVSIILWALDQKERRPLGWIQLPVPASQLSLARILTLTLTLSCAFAPMLAMLAVRGLAGLAITGDLVSRLVAAHAFTTFLIVTTTALSEELSAIAHRFRWRGVVALMVGWALVGFGFMKFYGDLSDSMLATPLAIAVVSYMGSAMVSVVAIHLYARRRNYLVGANPHHGLPEDWSSPKSRS